jgi:hypothetical protein
MKQYFRSNTYCHIFGSAEQVRRISRRVMIAFLFLAAIPKNGLAATVTLIVLAGQSNAEGSGSFAGKESDAFDPNASYWVPAAADNAVLFSFQENNRGINFNGVPDITSGSSPTFRTGLIGQTQVPPNDNPNRFPDVFIGPEVGIARSLYDPVSSPHVAIVKVAYGGTQIASWQKGHSSGLFNMLKSRVAAAKAELQAKGFTDVSVDGFFWQQGESDSSASNAAAYQSRLQTLINDFRADIGTSNTKVVLGGILNSIANASTINAAMQVVADSNPNPTIDSDPNTVWFSTNDLSLANTADGIHFSYAGALEMGTRFANDFKLLSTPEPGSVSLLMIGVGLAGLRNGRRFLRRGSAEHRQ